MEVGENGHGFLAFSEIHPAYYQIPVAHGQALIEAAELAHRGAEQESETRSNRRRPRHRNSRRRGNGERGQSESVESASDDPSQAAQPLEGQEQPEGLQPEGLQPEGLYAESEHADEHHHAEAEHHDHDAEHHDHDDHEHSHEHGHAHEHAHDDHNGHEHDHDGHDHDEHDHAHASESHAPESSDTVAIEASAAAQDMSAAREVPEDPTRDELTHDAHAGENAVHADAAAYAAHEGHEPAASEHAEQPAAPLGDDSPHDEDDGDEAEEEVVESVGGDDVLEEVPEPAFRPRRQYKIQEVIKRRQVMLVQVVKEERGNKGAALTTYLSLAGRYAALMPNPARGGGISRKITSAQDRSRLKEAVQDLDVPEGMGIILRTAGASRTKPEIKRDFEYLIRMWQTVRDMTLKSQAPTLVYAEGSLIKRSLSDLYNKEIDELQSAGEAGYHEARDFMKMLLPSNVRAVRQYRDGQPLFSRMGVESQLDAMFSPTVQLRSGGYIVINQTEALVSIDVNSGRSTRDHHIEHPPLKPHPKSANEATRQVRLRGLAFRVV